MKKSSYKAILLFYVVLLFLFFLFLLIFCSFFQIFLSLDLLTFSFPFSIQGFPLPLPSRAASFSSLSPPPFFPTSSPPTFCFYFVFFCSFFPHSPRYSLSPSPLLSYLCYASLFSVLLCLFSLESSFNFNLPQFFSPVLLIRFDFICF